VITTNVRFFEALHHNKPSVCRKLHRLAKSVILCDEVQSLPIEVPVPGSMRVMSSGTAASSVNLVVPTLATVSSFAAGFGSSVVFATATQPAFRKFDKAVRELAPYDWQPNEIAQQPGTLAIVNTRKDAKRLAELVKKCTPDAEVHHLSTNMCVAHREALLAKLKGLDVMQSRFLISTQCVEAGVDLDFRQVYRAWAPLDSIAQAAGRCNRNWGADCGSVVVFLPENAVYPQGGYEQAANISQTSLSHRLRHS